jgi:hypothetical protein
MEWIPVLKAILTGVLGALIIGFIYDLGRKHGYEDAMKMVWAEAKLQQEKANVRARLGDKR